MMPASLITGPFLGGDIVVMQWGADSPFAGEWDVQGAFVPANRHGARKFASYLHGLHGWPVLILRSIDLNGTLSIVDEEQLERAA